jgi:hypothetical protein
MKEKIQEIYLHRKCVSFLNLAGDQKNCDTENGH